MIEQYDNLTVVGEHDEKTIEQMQNCLQVEGSLGAIMPDGHLGYSQPVGGVAAYPEHISVSGVGYDIGCGNKLVVTDLRLHDVLPEDSSEGRWLIEIFMDEIVKQISFGMGRNNAEEVDHPVLDKIRNASVPYQRDMADLATRQLGTVGSGNHYVDLFYDEEGRICVGVHFGSRGFGHKTASGFINLASNHRWDAQIKGESMMANPVLLHQDSELGQAYIEAMKLAGEYAYAGRNVVCDKVCQILGANPIFSVHNHHNFAWRERHGTQEYWVVRKGATPAFPGQQGFVGATMGEQSVVIQGAIHDPESQTLLASLQDSFLYSTVHGAGRVMSRTQAKGKVKRRRRWGCSDRDCDFVSETAPGTGKDKRGPTHCPEDGLPLRQFWITEVKQKGAIDFPTVRAELAAKGIVLRGADADEAPGAYKRLSQVLEHCGPTVEVLHTLTPIGVAMAGPDVRDDYKD